MNVLLVDDNSVTADDLSFLFPNDIQLMWASGSERAMQLLRDETLPDVIILDLGMPAYLSDNDQREGLALLDSIKSGVAPDVPVVVVTSAPRDAMESACLAKGAHAYLQKPVDIGELIRELYSAVQQA